MVAVAPSLLAELLYQRRMTQVDLADKSEISRATIFKAYHGQPVSLDTWVKLANALNVPIVEIAPAAVAAQIVAVS